MIWWVLVLAVLTILSYLADAGVWTLLQDIRVPLLNASLLSVLLLLCTLGILIRMLHMRNRGEKERLRSMVHQVEQKPGA
jgi:predicted ABC-type exoprotein transport system permease subunit